MGRVQMLDQYKRHARLSRQFIQQAGERLQASGVGPHLALGAKPVRCVHPGQQQPHADRSQTRNAEQHPMDGLLATLGQQQPTGLPAQGLPEVELLVEQGPLAAAPPAPAVAGARGPDPLSRRPVGRGNESPGCDGLLMSSRISGSGRCTALFRARRRSRPI